MLSKVSLVITGFAETHKVFYEPSEINSHLEFMRLPENSFKDPKGFPRGLCLVRAVLSKVSLVITGFAETLRV
jgi:hypothetical protein